MNKRPGEVAGNGWEGGGKDVTYNALLYKGRTQVHDPTEGRSFTQTQYINE